MGKCQFSQDFGHSVASLSVVVGVVSYFFTCMDMHLSEEQEHLVSTFGPLLNEFSPF